jgi:hypothetical protein
MGEVPRVPPPFPHQQRMASPSPVVFEPVREIPPLPHITERPFVTASPPILVPFGTNTDECWVPNPHECTDATMNCLLGCVVSCFTCGISDGPMEKEPTCLRVYGQYVLLLINCLVCCPRKAGPFHRCGCGLYKSL